jgi:hypothetical protein
MDPQAPKLTVRPARDDERIPVMLGDERPVGKFAGEWAESLKSRDDDSRPDEVRILVAEVDGKQAGVMVLELFHREVYETGVDSYAGPFWIEDDESHHALLQSVYVRERYRHVYGVWPAFTEAMEELDMPVYGSFTNDALAASMYENFPAVERDLSRPPSLSELDQSDPSVSDAGSGPAVGL